MTRTERRRRALAAAITFAYDDPGAYDEAADRGDLRDRIVQAVDDHLDQRRSRLSARRHRHPNPARSDRPRERPDPLCKGGPLVPDDTPTPAEREARASSSNSDTLRFSPRFDIGDTMFVLHGSQKRQKFMACEVCGGSGRVDIDGASRPALCPECDGDGRLPVGKVVLFYTLSKVTVGQVTVEISTASPTRPEGTVSLGYGQWRTVRYMAPETGVGSGRSYSEATCFATEDEATAYAESRGWATEDDARALTVAPGNGSEDSR